MGRKKKSLEDAIFNITNQLDNIAKQTAKEVARKVKKDMDTQARKSVKHYYDSYSPEVYERTFSLYHSYKVLNETSDNRVKVTVEFRPELIEGEHVSNSNYHKTGDTWNAIDWKNEIPKGDDYGIPQADWILNNFWEGIHPRVKGSTYSGFTWNPKIDQVSPQDLFNEFINGSYISNEVIPYASEVLTNRVLKALKKQF